MKPGTPFRRIGVLIANYGAAMGALAAGAKTKAALDAAHVAQVELAGYRSRGHGEGLRGNKHSRHRVAMDKRAALKARNRARA